MARPNSLNAVIERLDADIARLELIRSYLTNGTDPIAAFVTEAPAPEPKKRRGRKPKAPKETAADAGKF